MSGGIFFALLAEIRFTAENRSKRMGGIADPVNCPTLFKMLASIAHDKYLTTNPINKTVSCYRTCTGQGGLKFDSSRYVHELNSVMVNQYHTTYLRMQDFIKDYLLNTEEARMLFAKKLIFFMTYAVNVKDNNDFIYLGKKYTKKEFLRIPSYDFTAFTLAIWHHIIKYLPNNRVGQETFENYFELDENKQEYFFSKSKLSNLTIGVTFDNIYSNEEEISVATGPYFQREIENEKVQLVNADYYANYIENAVNRLSKIKTVLYSKQPVDFYKIYVCNDVKRQIDYKDNGKEDEPLVSATPKKLLDKYGNFLTLTAPGGIGKSMFLKHLMLCENRFEGEPWLEPCGLVPVLITLKDYKKKYSSLEDLIFEKIRKFDNSIDFETFKNDLNKGIFLFLFDALDEINRSLLDEFISVFSDFSDAYNSNSFILSSRPNNFCDSLTNFTSLTLLQFRQEQAEKLVNKFDEFPKEKLDLFNKHIKIKDSLKISYLKAIDKIRKNPYSNIEGNPLLLTIKFLVFIETGKYLKNDTYLFYEKAYEVLYETHDQLDSQFDEREWATKLDMSKLKLLIGEFCFITYMNFQYSFTRSEIENVFDEMPTAEKLGVNPSDFIKDLKDNLTIFYLEGGRYSFIHKSFQEYFVAYYLSKLKKQAFSPALLSKIEFYRLEALDIERKSIQESIEQGTNTSLKYYEYEMYSVIDMFYQINQKKAEEFLILPIIRNICHTENKDPIEWLIRYIQNAYVILHLYDEYCPPQLSNKPMSDVVYYIIEEILGLDSEHEIKTPAKDFHYDRFFMYDFGNDEEIDPKETKQDQQENESFEGEMYEISNFDYILEHRDESKDIIETLKEAFKEEFSKVFEYGLSLEKKYSIGDDEE